MCGGGKKARQRAQKKKRLEKTEEDEEEGEEEGEERSQFDCELLKKLEQQLRQFGSAKKTTPPPPTASPGQQQQHKQKQKAKGKEPDQRQKQATGGTQPKPSLNVAPVRQSQLANPKAGPTPTDNAEESPVFTPNRTHSKARSPKSQTAALSQSKNKPKAGSQLRRGSSQIARSQIRIRSTLPESIAERSVFSRSPRLPGTLSSLEMSKDGSRRRSLPRLPLPPPHNAVNGPSPTQPNVIVPKPKVTHSKQKKSPIKNSTKQQEPTTRTGSTKMTTPVEDKTRTTRKEPTEEKEDSEACDTIKSPTSHKTADNTKKKKH